MHTVEHVDHASLANWGAACLRAVGCNDDDARTVADALVQTSLWGIDSHGIARLPHYLARIRAGSIEPRPRYTVTRTAPGTAQFDGGHGLGIAAAFAAMALAQTLAREAGIGAVGLCESTHCGAIGLYTRQAARDGLVGIAFTHADSIVAPARGTRKFLGTNPISIAFPRAGGAPLCLDMATSAIPWNRVMNARREGHRLPPDVALDEHGRPTQDANAAAALVPLGGVSYGHKGYALALMIDLLCGPLNGMAFADRIAPMFGDLTQRRRLGGLMIALDPARFAGGATLAQRVAEVVDAIRRQPGDVLYPGEPEERAEAQRRREGIPVEPGLRAEFDDWTQRLGVAPLR
jgi:ureidoglycolate dehydrogenase (NAD+)